MNQLVSIAVSESPITNEPVLLIQKQLMKPGEWEETNHLFIPALLPRDTSRPDVTAVLVNFNFNY